MVMTYLFFDDFLDFLAAFFFAAIAFTTFHAVRDLPVALTWQKAPEYLRQLISDQGERFDDEHHLLS